MQVLRGSASCSVHADGSSAAIGAGSYSPGCRGKLGRLDKPCPETGTSTKRKIKGAFQNTLFILADPVMKLLLFEVLLGLRFLLWLEWEKGARKGTPGRAHPGVVVRAGEGMLLWCWGRPGGC